MAPFTANNLWDNIGARPTRLRVGRGPGSGWGKTCGDGHKGQGARKGRPRPGFEGGQAPMSRRFPKFGSRPHRFNNGTELAQLNLGKLAYHIDHGHLDTSKVITQKDLKDAGVISKVKDGIKLLSKGADRFKELNVRLDLEITDASQTALEAIKEAGGSVSHKYRTDLLMRQHLVPHKFSQHKSLKTPMPAPFKVKKLEKLREKGIDVDYPRAPWYNDNFEKI